MTVRIEKVKLKDLECGDQIAIMGDVAELKPALKALMCIVEGSDKYFHHGIYDEKEKDVIELHGETKENAVPKRRPLLEFYAGREQLYRVVHKKYLPVDKTMKMAEDILNKKKAWPDYDVIANNCETFATYLKTGERRSQQVLEAIDRFVKCVFEEVGPAVVASSVAVCGSICGRGSRSK